MVRDDLQGKAVMPPGPERRPAMLEIIGGAMAINPAAPPPEEQARLIRQGQLLKMLDSDDVPTQWIALKELARIGDAEAAGAVYGLTKSADGDLVAAARIAYRQIRERQTLGRATTVDDETIPPEGKPGAELEREYLAESAPPPAVVPDDVPPPPEVETGLPAYEAPPPPEIETALPAVTMAQEAARPVAVETPTVPPEEAFHPLGPVADMHEAALLPPADDIGLIPNE